MQQLPRIAGVSDHMRRLALGVLTVFCLLPAAAAAEQPPLTLLAHSVAGFSRLDTYKGFFESPGGTVHIVNARAGTTRAVVLPGGCSNAGIHGPDFLLYCSGAYRIWDPWTGHATDVDLSRCDGYRDRISMTGIGRYWIAGRYDTGEYAYDDQGVPQYGQDVYLAVYVDRRSGRCRVSDEQDFGRDLNRPDLPAPHHGTPDKCTHGKRFILQYRPSSGMYVKLCAKRARWHPCRCGGIAGPNVIAWVAKGWLRVYFPVGGRRLWWPVPGADETDPYGAYATVLGDHIYVDVATGYPNAVPTYTVDVAPLVRR